MCIRDRFEEALESALLLWQFFRLWLCLLLLLLKAKNEWRCLFRKFVLGRITLTFTDYALAGESVDGLKLNSRRIVVLKLAAPHRNATLLPEGAHFSMHFEICFDQLSLEVESGTLLVQ